MVRRYRLSNRLLAKSLTPTAERLILKEGRPARGLWRDGMGKEALWYAFVAESLNVAIPANRSRLSAPVLAMS
jgi:hypothetical protein